MKKLKIIKIGLTIILVAQLGGLIILLATPQLAWAQDNNRYAKSLQFTPQVPIPGFLSTGATSIAVGTPNSSGIMSSDLLAKYIQALYKYGLAIGGILAAIVLMGGGVLWLVSAGNDSKVTQAKELISGSVIGLIILFSSWLLLDTINPNLTKLQTLNIQTLQRATLNLGCCLNKTTGKVSNDTQGECGANKFFSGKLANLDTNKCEIAGCCYDVWSGGQTSETTCQQSIISFCKNSSSVTSGDAMTFYQGQNCSNVPKCEGHIISNLHK